jgi:hypothetical protein
MKRLIAAFTAFSLGLLAATMAGMAVFGMGSTIPMRMDHGGHHAPAEPAAQDCASHCIAAAEAASLAVWPQLADTGVASALALLFAAALAVILPLAADFRPARLRWREGIGKLHVRMKLATVILRN